MGYHSSKTKVPQKEEDNNQRLQYKITTNLQKAVNIAFKPTLSQNSKSGKK